MAEVVGIEDVGVWLIMVASEWLGGGVFVGREGEDGEDEKEDKDGAEDEDETRCRFVWVPLASGTG